MSEGGDSRPALRMRAAETGVAAILFALGAVVVFDSVRLGFGWKEDGPQAGYFPFYVGALVCVSALINVVSALMAPKGDNPAFVEVGQLRLVLSVLVPTAVYAGLIGWIGIYVASAIFVAFFMRWLGKYQWWKVAAVAIGNSTFFFVVFEVWFKIPLPKGPLEAWLGLN